ncbi:MAG: vitamin B12 dependent-methionine synthase activation domain-containing protein, partial [Candidatus Omnitrophica bacterium]|nr:vitamin B12 dependent-methionine synthase activation domain-containing protein [Candidatus Omnitrophota bacterium]
NKKGTLADYFTGEPGNFDIVAFQAVTVGSKIMDAIQKLNSEKEFTKAYLLHGVSVHLAEALAEYVHNIVRTELKLKSDQGKRYSPGYPLWEDIKDQQKIFKLLEVEKRLNVRLSESFQMIPEASTTAMIIYNDRAEY